MSVEELIEKDFDSAVLVLCHVINAIPEILPPSAVCDYDLYNVLENLTLTSTSAVLFRLAKDKFEELTSNDEYLFDSDKNTKDEVKAINDLLKKINNQKLESLYYEELFEGSDFVFFALDYVNEVEELTTLLDSENETLLLKVLTLLKEKGRLNQNHKEQALQRITCSNIKNIVEVL